MTEICYSSDEAAEKLGVSETVLVRLSQYFKIPVDAYESEGFLSFKGDLSISEQDIRFFRMVRERLLEGESLEDVKTTLGPAALTLPQGAPRSDAKVKTSAMTVNNPEKQPSSVTMEPRAADFTARRPENYTSPVAPPTRKTGTKEGFKTPVTTRGVPTASRIASTFSSFLQEEAIKEVSIISKNKLNETTATREKPGKPVYSGQAQTTVPAQSSARIPAPTKTSATPPKPAMKSVATPLEPTVAAKNKPQSESFDPESFAFQPVSTEDLHPEDLTPPSGNTPPPVLVSMTQSPAYQKMAEKTFARYKGAQNPRKPSNVLKNMMREMKNAPEPEEFNPAEFTSHEHPVNPALQTNELFTGELTPQKTFSWDNYVGDPAARRAPGLSRNLQDAVMQFRQQAMQTP